MEMSQDISFAKWLCIEVSKLLHYLFFFEWWKNKDHRVGTIMVLGLSSMVIAVAMLAGGVNPWVALIPMYFSVPLIVIGMLYACYVDDMKKKGGE